jgi:hypothetical protein
MARHTPLSRTAIALEALGWQVEKVRRRHGTRHRSKAMLGLADLLCHRAGDPLLAVYVVTGVDPDLGGLLAARALPCWLGGARLEVWRWWKHLGRWRVDRCQVLLDARGQTVISDANSIDLPPARTLNS